MGEDLPAAGSCALRIDRNRNALRAELPGGFAHEFRSGNGSRVYGDLVGAGQQQAADILHRADAAAHRHRHEAAVGRAAHHIEDRIPLLVARGDIQEAKLVGARSVVELRLLHGIAHIAQVHEIDALHDPAGIDIQAGDDAHGQHSSPFAIRKAVAASIRPS